MSITVYADVIMPNAILAAGVRGKQIRKNTRTSSHSGAMRVNIDWSRTLRQYEFGFVPLSITQWQTIEGLHEVTEGGAYGFLLEDPKDNAVAISEGVATGLTSTTFQLYKRYTTTGGSRTKDRKLTRPRSSGFVIKVSGTPLGGGDYSLDTATGIVTIASAPAAANITWSGSFYVPVHFMNDEIDWDLVRGGPTTQRLTAGPNVTLAEVRE